MKITKEIIKDNTIHGAVCGLVISGILYVINKKYVNEVKCINSTDLGTAELLNKKLSNELNELELNRIIDEE